MRVIFLIDLHRMVSNGLSVNCAIDENFFIKQQNAIVLESCRQSHTFTETDRI